MLQRGTVVTMRDCDCQGVVVGTAEGEPLIQMVNGERHPFDSRTFEITSDFGGSELLDSELSDSDKVTKAANNFLNTLFIATLESKLFQTEENLRKSRNELEKKRNEQEAARRSYENSLRILEKSNNELRGLVVKLNLEKEKAVAPPETFFRLTQGGDELTPKMAVDRDTMVQITVNLRSASPRKKAPIILEHLNKFDEVVFAEIEHEPFN